MNNVRLPLLLIALSFAPWASATPPGDEASARAAILARFDAAQRNDVAALVFADSAVVTGHASVAATRDGTEQHIRISYAGVLAWREDRWQMTTWTSTLMAEAEAPR
jgi:hypothetical protein